MYNDCSHDDYLNEKTLTLIAVFTRLQGLKNEKQNVFFISSLPNFTQCVVMIFTPPPTPLRPQSLPLKKKLHQVQFVLPVYFWICDLLQASDQLSVRPPLGM